MPFLHYFSFLVSLSVVYLPWLTRIQLPPAASVITPAHLLQDPTQGASWQEEGTWEDHWQLEQRSNGFWWCTEYLRLFVVSGTANDLCPCCASQFWSLRCCLAGLCGEAYIPTLLPPCCPTPCLTIRVLSKIISAQPSFYLQFGELKDVSLFLPFKQKALLPESGRCFRRPWTVVFSNQSCRQSPSIAHLPKS